MIFDELVGSLRAPLYQEDDQNHTVTSYCERLSLALNKPSSCILASTEPGLPLRPLSCPDSHPILTNHWSCQPCGFSLYLWLGFVGWLFSFLVFPLFLWPASAFWSASGCPPCFSDGDTNMRISQDQLSSPRRLDRTVHVSCKLSGVPLENAIVHWYEEKEGEPLKRILYGSADSYKLDEPNSSLDTDKKEGGIIYLIINNVVKSDEATYYCACWDLTVSQSQKGPGRKPSLLLTLNPRHTRATTIDSSILSIMAS